MSHIYVMATRAERLNLYTEAAKCLFGSRWQSDAARHHGVSIRTMQRWAALEQDIPDTAFDEILRLLAQQIRDAVRIANLIARTIPSDDEPPD